MSTTPSIIEELTRIRDYLRLGVSQFTGAKLTFGHGTNNPWDEALVLIRHVLNLPQMPIAEFLDATLTLEERRNILAIFDKRIRERKPSAYLTNKAYFMGLEFYVDERTIVPRSPMAEILNHHLDPWLTDEPQSILDLCTGTGCIAIGASTLFPSARVVAIDIDPGALEVAKINIKNHDSTVELIQSDLFGSLDKSQQFDLIISNPPYVSDRELKKCSPEFQHEPKVAFLGGDSDGLSIVDRILRNAKQHLTPHGLLIVEIGDNIPALIQRYPKLSFIWPELEEGGEGIFMITAEDLNNI